MKNIIPDPGEARELRALFTGNPIIDHAIVTLRVLGVRTPATAVRALNGHYFAALSERERRAAVAWFVPEELLTRCASCGLFVELVLDGTNPGWFRHVDPPRRAHEALPRGGAR